MAEDRLYKIKTTIVLHEFRSLYLERFWDHFLIIIRKQISEFFSSQIFANLSINCFKIFSIKNFDYNLTLIDQNS